MATGGLRLFSVGGDAECCMFETRLFLWSSKRIATSRVVGVTGATGITTSTSRGESVGWTRPMWLEINTRVTRSSQDVAIQI